MKARSTRVYFHTFGCRANQYDTERMRQLLELRGCETASRIEEADACVVNSCTVTANADAELRRYIRRVRRRTGDRVRIVVAGCAAAVGAEAIRSLDGVSTVVRGQDPEAVADALGAIAPVRGAAPAPAILDRPEARTRAWLKVQDGCDLNCSYCAIRIARGRSRSRPMVEVVTEARALAEHHPEISLTGIHIGLYGKDLEPRRSFADLLAELLDRVPGVRFRIGSLECNQLSDRVIDLMAGSDGWLAPHLHVPLQSGSDRVLKRMRRAYLSGRYLSRVGGLCERVAPLGLGTDVIVGFPGETESDFEATLAIIERLPFTYIHVFPYSERTDTDAVGLSDPVPERWKTRRSKRLRERVRRKAEAHRRARIGTAARVVLEGDRLETAVTGDYLKVPADDSLRASGRRLQDATIEADANARLRAVAGLRAEAARSASA